MTYSQKFLMNIGSPRLSSTVAVGWGIVLGLIILFIPLYWSIGLLAISVIVPIIIKKPELAVLGILAISSTILEEEFVPTIPVGPLQLYATDIIAFFLLFILLSKKIIIPGFRFTSTPLVLPLLIFFSVAMISTFLGFLRSPGSELNLAAILREPPTMVSLAIPEIRIVSYYLIFFLVLNTLQNKLQVRTVTYGIIILSVFIVFALVAQEILGTSIKIIPGRVETLVTGDIEYIGITRVTGFSGEKILLLALVLVTTFLAIGENIFSQIIKIGTWIIIFTGVLITFSRSIWGAYAVAMLLLFFFLKKRERATLVKWFLFVGLICLILIGIILLVSNEAVNTFIHSSIDRALTLFDPSTYQDPSSTFRWRDFEYQWARKKILELPFFGTGLGAYYRPWLPGIDWENFDGRGFVHNAHVWILVKTGILGYLAFLIFSSIYIARGLKHVKKIVDTDLKAVLYGCIFTYIGFMVGAITAPMFMLYSTTPVIGVMIGLSESVILIDSINNSQKSAQ